MTDQEEIDRFFESQMPGPETQPLFELARELGIGFYLGYAELTEEAGQVRRYNTAILVERDGRIVGRYRKIHLPGHSEHLPQAPFQHLEKRYFDVGNEGFKVWRAYDAVVGMCICNDRRWPETYRVMGLQGVEIVALGYNTPIHQLQPDTSYNADLSLEQHLRGSDVSFKVTPFYRSTRNQLQPVPIGVGGVVSGFNVGQQTSTGVELAIRKGDFARDGFAAQLAYTYTHSRIKYNNFPSGTNVIDGLNLYIQEYNSYTSACGTIIQANSALCGLSPGASNPNAQATFASSTPGVLTPNPYYNAPAQPLLDRNGS